MNINLSETYIDCPSCLRRNEADMNFCMYCGTGLKPEVEQKRVTDLSMLKPCMKCGKADSLSEEFCVYCGTPILVPGSSTPDSSAYKKFTWELERIEPYVEQIKQEVEIQSAVKVKRQSSGMNWTVLLGVMGLVCGAVASYFLGQEQLQKIFMQLSWPSDGIVVYVEPRDVNYSLLDQSGKSYVMGKSSSNGSFSIKGVKPGKYYLKLSAPHHRTVVQREITIREKGTTVLGYPRRIILPAKEG